MLAPLILAVAMSTAPAVPTLQKICRYANAMQLVNIPISPAEPATDVVRAFAVTDDGRLIGNIYVLRDGAIWYSDGVGGLLGLTPRPTVQESSAAMNAIGAAKSRQMGVGELIPVKDISLSKLVAAGFGLYSCY